MVIGESVWAGLRRYPTLWRTFFSVKSINLGIGGDRAKNVLQRVDDIVLPKSARSVVKHCGTNSTDTSNSDEISLGIAAIAWSSSHRQPDVKVTVSGLSSSPKYWSYY